MMMRINGQHVRAVRPKMGFFALLLVLASARAHGVSLLSSPLWLVGLTFALSTGAIVALNDFVDREHDQGKARTLASDDPAAMLAWASILWGVTAAGAIAIWRVAPQALVWLLPALVLGLAYSWLRKVPLLSGVVVSFCYALSAPLAASVSEAGHGGWRTVFIGVAIGLFVYGRETIADLADLPIDRGYKMTLPVLLGAPKATVALGTIFALGAIFAILSSPWVLLFLPLTLSLIVTTSEHPLRFDHLYKQVDWLTIGFVVVLLLRG